MRNEERLRHRHGANHGSRSCQLAWHSSGMLLGRDAGLPQRGGFLFGKLGLAATLGHLLHVDARALARMEAGDDKSRLTSVEESYNEALLTAHLGKRVEAHDADVLQRCGRLALDRRQPAPDVLDLG